MVLGLGLEVTTFKVIFHLKVFFSHLRTYIHIYFIYYIYIMDINDICIKIADSQNLITSLRVSSWQHNFVG